MLLFLETVLLEELLVLQMLFQFSIKCENFGAIPYLERYLVLQFSCRIVKTSFGNSRLCFGILIS